MRQSNPFIAKPDLIAAIVEACETSPHACFGLRIEDGRSFVAGEFLPDSRVWDGFGEPTDVLLDGVATISLGEEATEESVTAALEALAGYYGDRLVLVGGRHQTDGEDDGEAVIRNGQCVACW
jgi:hypothetical protein